MFIGVHIFMLLSPVRIMVLLLELVGFIRCEVQNERNHKYHYKSVHMLLFLFILFD